MIQYTQVESSLFKILVAKLVAESEHGMSLSSNDNDQNLDIT